jgi:hypothetical protein
MPYLTFHDFDSNVKTNFEQIQNQPTATTNHRHERKTMNILITGKAGPQWSLLTARLKGAGHEVIFGQDDMTAERVLEEHRGRMLVIVSSESENAEDELMLISQLKTAQRELGVPSKLRHVVFVGNTMSDHLTQMAKLSGARDGVFRGDLPSYLERNGVLPASAPAKAAT